MLRRFLIAVALLLAPFHQSTWAVQAGGASPPTPSVAGSSIPKEEIDQLVAPIALYPDALVSQILMASTYPLEIVQADRWVKANPGVTGDALAKALNEQTWDASVKSLTGFTDVLSMMSEKVDWTTKLGNAFLAQQKDVLAAIQDLRKRANDAGNLKSTEQQKVEVQQSGASQTIVIESTSPDVIYVPTYDPVVVYGTWPYPAYPPAYYYPPGYVAGTALLSFGVGLACGAAWGWAWGDCDWHGGDVNINVDRNTNFNQNINRTQIKNELSAKGLGDGRGQWQHDGSHRQGVSYRDNATAQRFGKGTDADAARSREQFRGKAEAGQRDLQRGAADDFRGSGGAANRAGQGDRGSGPTAADRSAGGRAGGAAAGDRSPGGRSEGRAPSADRTGGYGSQSVFQGSDRSGSSTRAASSRGSSSRASSASAGSRGGRSGGGVSRGGGGGRGGGGRR